MSRSTFHRPTPVRATLLRAALATAVAVTLVIPTSDAPAFAAGDGGSGASSRVVGRGDILTSIIGWRVRRAGSHRRAVARCRWITLRDAQIEWLVAVSAGAAALDGPHPVLEAVHDHLDDGQLPDGDVQVRVCGAEVLDVRFVARSGPLPTVELLHRQMITRIPPPEPTWSPPAGTSVPLHQPVFVSIAESGWREIHSTVTVDGVTAEVRADPVGLRVISGDPVGRTTLCAGPGAGFDPSSTLGPRSQALRDGACTFDYASTSGLDGRPSTWIGTVTVLWRARWRTTAGEWTELGTIPRTRLFDRTTREVRSTIESPLTRRFGPSRAAAR